MLRDLQGLFLGSSVRARALRGTAASLSLSIGEHGLRFVSNLVLTRILFPEAFGLMAIVHAILIGVELLSDFGARSIVIQSPRGDDADFLNTVWTLKCVRGLILWLAICATAPFFADLYDQQMLAQILPVAGVSVLVAGAFPSKELSVSRHMKLGRYAAVKLVAQFIGLCGTALLAWKLETVWALALGLSLRSVIDLMMFQRFLPGLRNRFCLERESLLEIFSFGKYLYLNAIAIYVTSHSDRAILGLFIPIDILGLYNIAFALTSLPFLLAQNIIISVIFPLYRMRHPLDAPGNRKKVVKARRLVSLLTLSGLCSLAFIGPWLIELLYDDRYILSGAVSVLLCLGLVPSVALYGTLYAAVAKGDTFRFMVLNAVTAACQGVLLYLAVQSYGLVGAPFAIGLAPLVTYPLLAYFLRMYGNWDPAGDAVLMLGASAMIGFSIWLHFDDVGRLLP